MKSQSIRNVCRLAVALLLLPVAAAQADTISVDANGGAGVVAVAADSQCSLREAMLLGNGAAANGDCVAVADSSGSLDIDLPAGATFTLLDGPYAGSYTEEAGPTGLPLVTGDFAIVGHGATIARDTAASTPKFRLLQISFLATLEISNLSLEHGWAAGHPFDYYNFGGCVYNRGTLYLTDVNISDCVAVDDDGNGGQGGGMLNFGTLVMNGGSINDNHTRIADASGPGGRGGGFFNQAFATLTGVTISGNRVGGSNGAGGGIYNMGNSLTIDGCTITGNDANWNDSTETGTHRGGGIANDGSTLIVIDSLISNNRARLGGGIAAYDNGVDTTVQGSTISGNTAYNGAGLDLDDATGMALIVGSLLRDNDAAYMGGGLFLHQGSAVLANTTLTGNTAQFGGGVIVDHEPSQSAVLTLSYVSLIGDDPATIFLIFVPDGSVHIDRTLVAGGNVFNCETYSGGSIVSHGYNLSDDGSCGFTQSTDLSSVNPQLGALADNGGGTKTLRPLPGSPVIDAVPAADCALNVPTGVDASIDQRDVARPQGQGCDIGAVEVAPYVANFVAYGGGGQHALAGDPFAWPLVVQARDAQGYGIEGLQLTIDVPTSGASASCSPSVTDATGVLLTYCIANQQVGSYQVSIAVPAGRSATSPAPSYSFTLANDLNDRIFGDGFDGSPLATVVMAAGQGSASATFSVPPGLLAKRIVPILVVRDAQGHRVALVEARRDRDGTRIRVIEYDARGYPLRVGAWHAPAATRLQLHVERQAGGVTTALQAEAK